MDKRTLTALALAALVIVIVPMVYPSSHPAPTPPADTTVTPNTANGANGPNGANAPVNPAPTVSNSPAGAIPPVTAGARAKSGTTLTPAALTTVPLTTSRATYGLSNPGAAPVSATIRGFKTLRPGRKDTLVRLAETSGPLLRYRLALGADTISLDTLTFNVAQTPTSVIFTSPRVEITYQATNDGYRTSMHAIVANAPPQSTLLVDLPTALESVEADTLDDVRHFAYAYKAPLRDVTSIPFTKLDTATARSDTGSFQWVSMRSKYWLLALMQPIEPGAKAVGVFRGLAMRGGPRVNKLAPTAYATTSYPITNGQITFDLYLGPQSWQELTSLGNDLVNVNPYAGLLHGVVQPFSTIVMRILLWMKATFRVNYGWVLVLFGVMIRLILWPLNQRAMKTSIAMQRIQPEVNDINKRYKSDPQKQREALVKVYQAHGMSPLSPLLGCLPMLLPMPILFSLYFVFQNTIEFRGVSFLWLPDLALRDPYFIIPVLMGASMFLLSWIGMRAAPPNPQTKMMSYMMPVMLTVMFFNLASGLNLYYAVQNLASLPQQWLVAKHRASATGKT